MDQKTVKDILRCHEVPMNYTKCRYLWIKVMDAFKKDPSFTIVNEALYRDFEKYSRPAYMYIAAFLGKNKIIDKEDGYNVVIARNTGGELKCKKDKNGAGFLYSTDDPKLFIEFGITPEINEYRHPFYRTCGVNVIYHYSQNKDGHAQAVRTLGGTKYYDERGNCGIGTQIWGMLDDLMNNLA